MIVKYKTVRGFGKVFIHCAWGAILRQSDSTPLHKTVPPNPIRLEENTIDPNKIKGIQISGIFTSHEERHINKQRERERERERESCTTK